MDFLVLSPIACPMPGEGKWPAPNSRPENGESQALCRFSPGGEGEDSEYLDSNRQGNRAIPNWNRSVLKLWPRELLKLTEETPRRSCLSWSEEELREGRCQSPLFSLIPMGLSEWENLMGKEHHAY